MSEMKVADVGRESGGVRVRRRRSLVIASTAMAVLAAGGLLVLQNASSASRGSDRLAGTLEVVDASTDQVVASVLADTGAIELDDPSNEEYGFNFVGAPSGAESMTFGVDGPVSYDRLENVSPYSVFGNDGQDFWGTELPVGEYTIRAEAFSQDRGRGSSLGVQVFEFEVTDGPIVIEGTTTTTEAPEVTTTTEAPEVTTTTEAPEVTTTTEAPGTTPPPSTPEVADPPVEPSQCTTPGDVIDLTNWKLTIPYATDSGSGDGNTNTAAEIYQPSLSSYSLPGVFTNSGCDYVQFKAHVGGATTSSSGYPRLELREMTDDGRRQASWASTIGTHSMETRLRATRLPEQKPHLVVAQIHDNDDDILTVRVEGDTVGIEVDGDNGPTLDTNYQLGEIFTVRLEVSNGMTRTYFNGDLVHTLEKAYSGAYFRVGAYTQSACDGDKQVAGEDCASYGEAEIFDLDVSHR